MPKRSFGAFVTMVVLAGIMPANAGGDPVTISPNPIRQNKTLNITAKDCKDAEGATAALYISIIRDGELIYSFHGPPDPSGTTEKNIKMRKSKYPTGSYTVYVDCIQVFSKEHQEPTFNVEETLKVKKAKK